jgi:hypothetical protein
MRHPNSRQRGEREPLTTLLRGFLGMLLKATCSSQASSYALANQRAYVICLICGRNAQ